MQAGLRLWKRAGARRRDSTDGSERAPEAAGRGASVLTAEGITKRFAGVTALRDVDFEVACGEVHALMGENGAGKSTLMKILSGVHTQFEGTVGVDGEVVNFASVRDAEAAGIAIIHQEFNLVPELNVSENIFLGREPLIAGVVVDRKASVAAAGRLLARLGIDLDSETRINRLRVGEQQLVEIAKALSMSARILIMDEPTSALSPGECRRLFKIIGVAIVYISHRIDEVMLLARRVTVLRDGRRVLTAPMQQLDRDRIIGAMVGRDMLGGPSVTRAAVRVEWAPEDAASKFRMLRLSYFPPADPVMIGPMACSPQRAGFEARFRDFKCGPALSPDLHG